MNTEQLRHVMIDLETLGIMPDSRIISIGAVMFDPRYNRVDKVDTFYMELDHKAQTDRMKYIETVQWWATQPKESRAALKGTTPINDALEELAFWLPGDCKVWGNGATFDISMLEDAYIQNGIGIPWKFWNIRDMRTVKDLYESARGGFDKKSGGVAHNALDDAMFQARSVCYMWREILKQGA